MACPSESQCFLDQSREIHCEVYHASFCLVASFDFLQGLACLTSNGAARKAEAIRLDALLVQLHAVHGVVHQVCSDLSPESRVSNILRTFLAKMSQIVDKHSLDSLNP
jgi:hypothetical protein